MERKTSLNFGGQVGYLWGGMFGAEAIAEFTPSMQLSGFELDDDPTINSYMANAIAAFPFGSKGDFQPYVSGGFGAIQMRADVPAFLVGQPVDDVGNTSAETTTSTSEQRFATNIGGGLMAFASHVGIRTDVRFYRAVTDEDPIEEVTPDAFTRRLLAGLEFWRANVGIALRW
jgi:hypothetical protein